MNKKFSTLVAALLASGGLFYAVDAMILPASDGVAKTFVTAAATTSDATGTIIGYTLGAGDYTANMAADWSLESATNGKFYLQIGEGFYLNSKLQAQKGKEGATEFTVANGVIEGLYIENGVLAATGTTPAGLFAKADGAIASTAAAGTNYLLGGVTYATPTLNALDANSEIFQMIAEAPAKANVTKITGTATSVSITATVEAKQVSGIWYLHTAAGYVDVTSDGTITYTTDAPTTNAETSKIAFGASEHADKVMLGSKYLKIAEGAISVTTTNSEGNAYLVANDIGSASVTVLTRTDDLSTSSSYCLLGLVTKGTVADNDFSVAFDAAVEAENKMIALGEGDYSSNFSGLATTSAKFSTTASGQLKLGESFVVYTSSGVALGATGNDFILQSDGSFKYGEIVLKSGEDVLYAYDKAAKIYTNASSVGSNLVLSTKSETAAVNNLTTSSKVSVATAKYAEEGVPGADIEGMGNEVTVAKDGTIELVAGVNSTDAIPAPFTVTSDNEVLAANSWILVGGKLKSLAAEKAGDKEMYLGNKTKATAYALVKEADAITGITYTAQGLVINGSVIATTPKTTGEALAVANADKSVSSGNIVKMVVAGTVDDDVLYKITVSQVAGTETYAYTFAPCKATGEILDPNAELPIYMGGKYDGSVSLKLDGKWQTYDTNSNGFVDAVAQKSIGFKAVKAAADAKPYNVGQLLNDFGSKTSFGVALAHKYVDEDGDAATKAINTGNVFADADLVPVKYDVTEKKLVVLTGDKNSDEEAFLLKNGSSYIVLETTKDSEWTSVKDGLTEGGYKFATVNEKAMLEILANQGAFNKKTYAPYFTFNYNNVANEDGKGKVVYNIAVKNVTTTGAASITSNYYISSFEVKTGAQKGVYLTVASSENYWVAAELGLNNLVKAKSDESPLNHTYVNIQFANHPSVKDYNGKLLNGRVLGADLITADKSEFLFNKPEGQWIVNVGDNQGELNKKGVADQKDVTSFTFVNRESGRTYTVNAMYYLGDNKYAVSSSRQYAASPANRDTLIITGVQEKIVAGTAQRDGYADLKALDVQDELFRLLVASAEEDYYVGENHTAKSHFLGLSHDEEAAVNWRIVPLTGAREYDKDGFLKTATDSIYEFRYSQYFKDDKLFSKNDTLAIIGYALQNVANGEYLTYERPQTTTIQSMICDPKFTSFKTTKNVSNAYRFVLKEKGTDLYNIVSVDNNPTYDADGYLNNEVEYFTLGSNKLYGATTLTKQGAVEVEGMYAQINSNDLFKVQKVGAPEYRLMNMGDTIRIFRQENEYDQMYEKGEFLNIGNKAQLTDMAPALYVDTAYVKRGHNNRYQYLLAVNPKYVPAEPCTIPGHPTVHPDTTYGRFLVNLIDTANVAYRNGAIHTNKYINDTEAGETCAKLGFVYGFRTGDKLYITDKNYKKSAKASDVIDLSTRDFNVAKFAFRYINPINHESDGSFKIQTGYYDYNTYIATNKQPEVSNNGYLKNINGVLVVTSSYDNGDKFDLAAEKSKPTANDEVTVSTFSVVPADGAVIIKGAAGKAVVITNLLGQTIANTVISSDNAPIAVPAGIVIVAVDGEEAVKAIVK